MNVIKMRPSHLPILSAVMEVIKLNSCVECGSGIFSTPLLSKIPKFKTIEHDQEWAKKAIEAVGPEKCTVFPLLGMRYNIYPEKTAPRMRKKIATFYKGIAEQCDLLFIDSFAAVRDIILAAYWNKFEVAVLHDTQNPAYGYQRIIEKFATPGTFQIQCKPKKAGEPWTDVILPRTYYARAKTVISAVKPKDYDFTFTIKEWL